MERWLDSHAIRGAVINALLNAYARSFRGGLGVERELFLGFRKDVWGEKTTMGI